MGIRSFFHQIKMVFARTRATAIPPVSAAKQYGNRGEDAFVRLLQQALPNCALKRNVVITTSHGNAEIDCLVLYRNKLFAIEVKHWKGKLTEVENGFIQEKADRWTGEIHTKYLQSPFRQLGRAIFLLRKQIPVKAWINAVVFFEDSESGLICTASDQVWFCHIEELAKHICSSGEETYGTGAADFFRQCVPADYLYANTWRKSLHCVIDRSTLQSTIPMVPVDHITSIHITHHWSYDTLCIHMVNGEETLCQLENAQIQVNENGRNSNYGLCKLDYIEFGRALSL